jgi:prepilin-type N-terminal cleavage/methylation domain-containing protein
MKRADGFSLLETIVVLAVVGLLIAGLAEGARAGLRAWSTETRMSRTLEDDAPVRVLRGLIARTDTGDLTDPLPFVATPHTLAFATSLPVVPPGLETRDVAVEIAREGQALVLRYEPRLPSPLHPPAWRREVLATGVASLDIAVWREGWHDRFAADGMPDLVRIRIIPDPGGRAIPDIVAHPFRAPVP